MISLLQFLHEIAAQRGDGLHPELYRRLTQMDNGSDVVRASKIQDADPCGMGDSISTAYGIKLVE